MTGGRGGVARPGELPIIGTRPAVNRFLVIAMSDFIKVCEQAARAGGAVLIEKFGHVTAREKGPADLVTEADFASQEAIRRRILGAFPDHAFLGEEGQTRDADRPHDAAPGGCEFRWIVDPLDGTTNYVHGVPHFSVSLALERAGELAAACVYDPVAEECFTAVAGQGACLNGEAIRTSTVWRPEEALASTGFPAMVQRDSVDVRLFLEGLQLFQALRRTGSAALNLSYVAAGRFDAAWSLSTKVWDVAAGVLLIREAGGVVTSPNGGPLALEQGKVAAAANGRLHAQLLAMMARAGL